jgi:hypothetical protein
MIARRETAKKGKWQKEKGRRRERARRRCAQFTSLEQQHRPRRFPPHRRPFLRLPFPSSLFLFPSLNAQVLKRD